MANHVKGFVVALDKDMHPEDAEQVKAALGMVKHVLSVDVVEVDLMDDYINRSRIHHDLGLKLLEIVYPKKTT